MQSHRFLRGIGTALMIALFVHSRASAQTAPLFLVAATRSVSPNPRLSSSSAEDVTISLQVLQYITNRKIIRYYCISCCDNRRSASTIRSVRSPIFCTRMPCRRML